MFSLFEHQADIGIRGFGSRPERAFEEAAKAMFSIMVEPASVQKKKEISIEAKANDLNALLVEWLNEIVLQKDLAGMFFSDFKVEKIEQKGDELHLKGKAIGELIDLRKHKIWTEVKAATYSELKVFQEGTKWVAQCIVDV